MRHRLAAGPAISALLSLAACNGAASKDSNAINAAAQASAQEMHNIMLAEERAADEDRSDRRAGDDHHAR